MDLSWLLLVGLVLIAAGLLVLGALISIEKKTIEVNDPWDQD